MVKGRCVGWERVKERKKRLYLALLSEQQPLSRDCSQILYLQIPVITKEELHQGDCSF